MQRKNNKRGMAVVYMVFGIVIFGAFASLSIDLGRVQLAKTQERNAADAAARAATSACGNVSVAQSRASAIANSYSVDGTAVSLNVNQDIDFGNWNSATKTFSVLNGSNRVKADSIRVTVRRTASNAKPISLFFGGLIGKSQCDVSASAIANFVPGGYSIVGLDYIKMTGSSSDSYWGAPGTTGGQQGNIASNGDITVGGGSVINGTAWLTAGHNLINSGTVTGGVRYLSGNLVYANGDPLNYATINDNGLLPSNVKTNGGLDFKAQGNTTYLLPGGNFYFRNIDATNGAQMTFTGPATFYVYGTVNIAGHTDTYPTTARNLTLIMVPKNGNPPGSVTIATQADFYASIYAPQSAVVINASADIYGNVVGKSIDMSGSGCIHYDLTAPNAGGIKTVR